MVHPSVDLSRMTPMAADETASLLLITGDQYLFRFRNKGGTVAYKFLSPASVRAAFAHETIDTQWLPPNVRRWGIGKHGEWLLVTHPPHVYELSFASLQGNETVTLQVPMPALAFLGYGQRYHLWAFNDRELSANTPLFAAPLPNVDGNGSICFGTNIMPQASARTIGDAWNLFLASPFSNHSINGKSKAFPEDVRVQLEKLAQSGRRRYPLRDLVPLRTTANQAIENALRGV